MEIEFGGLPDDVHHCTTFQDGEWTVWRCPHCDGYERRYNWRTREMKVKGGTGARHTGSSEGKENVAALAKGFGEN